MGSLEARRLVEDRPQAVLNNAESDKVPPVPGLDESPDVAQGLSWLTRMFRQP